jgi:UDP-3-O-[3-hydroxymyristoyl] glucosamine N-acyltransferase
VVTAPPSANARVALAELVERFGGQCGGDLRREVVGFATLKDARPDQLGFVNAARYRDEVRSSRAAAVLVSRADADRLADEAERLWVCDDPYLQFARVAQWFDACNRPPEQRGAHRTAVIDDEAQVDASALIGPLASIGARTIVAANASIGAGTRIARGVRIGEGTIIHAGVTIYDDCLIGARCVVHSGAVIGADGFGFAKDGERWEKIPQAGRVVVGDDVEIGANTTIDRGTLDDTRIGNGVKLDNQIQVAHNVRIGEHTIMAAFVGIAGSATIGRRCMIGGAARIMGHVTIADDTVVSTQTFVSRSITKAGHYTGYYPMAEHAAFEKSAAVLRRLDGLRDRVKRLEAQTEASTEARVDTERQPTSEPERPA